MLGATLNRAKRSRELRICTAPSPPQREIVVHRWQFDQSQVSCHSSDAAWSTNSSAKFDRVLIQCSAPSQTARTKCRRSDRSRRVRDPRHRKSFEAAICVSKVCAGRRRGTEALCETGAFARSASQHLRGVLGAISERSSRPRQNPMACIMVRLRHVTEGFYDTALNEANDT